MQASPVLTSGTAVLKPGEGGTAWLQRGPSDQSRQAACAPSPRRCLSRRQGPGTGISTWLTGEAMLHLKATPRELLSLGPVCPGPSSLAEAPNSRGRGRTSIEREGKGQGSSESQKVVKWQECRLLHLVTSGWKNT